MNYWFRHGATVSSKARDLQEQAKSYPETHVELNSRVFCTVHTKIKHKSIKHADLSLPSMYPFFARAPLSSLYNYKQNSLNSAKSATETHFFGWVLNVSIPVEL